MDYISYEFKNDTLFIKLGERLETTNAEATENEINEARTQNPAGSVVLDAENLKYISWFLPSFCVWFCDASITDYFNY